jgi:hypothetical protein
MITINYENKTINFIEIMSLEPGGNSTVKLYHATIEEQKKFYVIKTFFNHETYIKEKDLFTHFDANNKFPNIKCKLIMYNDKSDTNLFSQLIYEYLGIDLSNFVKIYDMDINISKKIMFDVIEEIQYTFSSEDKFLIHVDIKPSNICIKFKGYIQLVVHNSYVYILDERIKDNKFKKYKIGIHEIKNIISGLIDDGYDVCLIDYGNYLTNETKIKNIEMLSTIPSILTIICEQEIKQETSRYIYIIAQYWSLLYLMFYLFFKNINFYIILQDCLKTLLDVEYGDSLYENMYNLCINVIKNCQDFETVIKYIYDSFQYEIESNLELLNLTCHFNKDKLYKFMFKIFNTHKCYNKNDEIERYNLDNIKTYIMEIINP